MCHVAHWIVIKKGKKFCICLVTLGGAEGLQWGTVQGLSKLCRDGSKRYGRYMADVSVTGLSHHWG